MNLYRLILPLGILTYSSLLFTILVGRRVIKISFKYHKLSAVVTLVLASCHGFLAVFLNYFN